MGKTPNDYLEELLARIQDPAIDEYLQKLTVQELNLLAELLHLDENGEGDA